MFNYIHETILNKAGMIETVDDGKSVVVKRAGKYVLDKIESKYVAKGAKGVAGTAKFAFAAPSDGAYARLSIFVHADREFAEYAFPDYAEFGKPVLVESAAKSAEDLKKAIELALNPGNEIFEVKVDGSDITLTVADPYLDFAEVAYEQVKPLEAGAEEVSSLGDVTIVHSVVPFATGEWIRENLRFPSAPNMRYSALFADEAPIAGQIYNMYSFQYRVAKAVPGGLSAVNQVVESLTTHVFYLPADSEAETEFKAAFGDFVDAVAPGE